jgi:rSAM/selenodomain-associated transferase 1
MNRLLLFARRPLLGRVKTRLVPPLDDAQALALYRGFLCDQLAFAARLPDAGIAPRVCFDAPWDPDPEIARHLAGLEVVEQGPGDLGERLTRAFRASADDGAENTVAMGADSPTVPLSLVREAFERLDAGADAVVSPARDGGYVLVGMRTLRAGLFREVPWGGARVLVTTRARASEEGLRLAEVGPWYDVDDADGLSALRDELRSDDTRRRAPETARCIERLDDGGALDSLRGPVL